MAATSPRFLLLRWLWGVNCTVALYLLSGYVYPYPGLPWASSLLFVALAWPVVRWPLAANLVTAGRLALALSGFVFLSIHTISPLAFAAFMILSLALDGLDGWLARRTGPTSYGALFDMECDNAWLAALWLAVAHGDGLLAPLGLIIPCYRVGLVALRAVWPQVPAPHPRSLLGLPQGKVLFVAVAALSLLTYGLSAPSLLPQFFGQFIEAYQLTITSLLFSSSNVAQATTLLAVACSTYSFWPEYKVFFTTPSRG